MFRYYHVVASMVAVSFANVVFNIPDSTSDSTDVLTSGVDVVDIRWPKDLVFSSPVTTTYGDLYLITKQDERMVARIPGWSYYPSTEITLAHLYRGCSLCRIKRIVYIHASAQQ